MVKKMSVKVPYEVMALEVEKLYRKEFEPHDPAIPAHCEFIGQFIRSCGWTEVEYWERWYLEEEKVHPLLKSRDLNLS